MQQTHLGKHPREGFITIRKSTEPVAKRLCTRPGSQVKEAIRNLKRQQLENKNMKRRIRQRIASSKANKHLEDSITCIVQDILLDIVEALDTTPPPTTSPPRPTLTISEDEDPIYMSDVLSSPEPQVPREAAPTSKSPQEPQVPREAAPTSKSPVHTQGGDAPSSPAYVPSSPGYVPKSPGYESSSSSFSPRVPTRGGESPKSDLQEEASSLTFDPNSIGDMSYADLKKLVKELDLCKANAKRTVMEEALLEYAKGGQEGKEGKEEPARISDEIYDTLMQSGVLTQERGWSHVSIQQEDSEDGILVHINLKQ